MWYFFPSEGGELIPWCPEVVPYIIQPGVTLGEFIVPNTPPDASRLWVREKGRGLSI